MTGMRRLGTPLILSLTVGLLVLLVFPVPAGAQERPDWGWPLAEQPTVVRGFEPPAERWMAGHRGVDLLSRDGAVVRAAGRGTVSFAGSVGGKGVVAVTHADGTRTTYEPVRATVAPGELVQVGDPIGRLVAGAGHCLPHACLHWGRRRDEVYLDPLALVGAARARLLPVWGPPAPPAPAGAGRLDPADRGSKSGRLRAVAARGRWGSAAAGLGGVLAVGAVGLLARRRRERARSQPRPDVIDLESERARRRAIPPPITA